MQSYLSSLAGVLCSIIFLFVLVGCSDNNSTKAKINTSIQLTPSSNMNSACLDRKTNCDISIDTATNNAENIITSDNVSVGNEDASFRSNDIDSFGSNKAHFNIPHVYQMPRKKNIQKEFFDITESITLQMQSYQFMLTYVKRSIGGERFFLLSVKNTKNNLHGDIDFTNFDQVQTLYLADLNANTYPEIYIIWSSDGSGAYGLIEGYEFSNTIFHEIEFPKLPQGKGYRGHDKFIIYPDYIEHSYPLYAENDANTVNSLGTAYLRYSLKPNSFIVDLEQIY